LPVVAPSLVLLALVGMGALVRRGWRDPWLTATLGAAAGLVSTVTIAFIANRYLADATPALVLPAALGAWVTADWLSRHHGWWRRAVVGAVVGLSAVGLAVSAALALQSQRLFILPRVDARLDLVRFQYDLHDRLGGTRPPGVREADAIDAPGPRGEVVILDGCRGLYWSDRERWWPLELGGTDGLLVTSPLADGRTVLLDAPTWRLVGDADGDTVTVSYLGDDGTVRTGQPLPRAAVDGVPLRVELDRVNGELNVRAGTRDVLIAWLVDLGGQPSPGRGVDVGRAPTPLCRDLQARLHG
jgi:hypothetical protein